MEPVEINAGEYYLRAFRHDDRISDVPALIEIHADPETRRYMTRLAIYDESSAKSFIELMANGWAKDYRWSWAVCEAVTADLVAGIIINNLTLAGGESEVTCWTHPEHRGKGVLPLGLNAVLGWVFGATGVRRVIYKHSVFNKASQRVAEKCGFTLEGRLRETTTVDDQRVDELQWSRLATDPQP
ncbi:GNAT family N-acetyltransferase [Lentzea aerocolonigenes]|uniref:GNAT family N-acetyltransferase n=1 Tax=Lentzea aerocolonigenes TaxID=68170 RepID=UPI000698E92C|nr:GNAT family N-acetyltransferase [Lentzea aerocolonigenes]